MLPITVLLADLIGEVTAMIGCWPISKVAYLRLISSSVGLVIGLIGSFQSSGTTQRDEPLNVLGGQCQPQVEPLAAVTVVVSEHSSVHKRLFLFTSIDLNHHNYLFVLVVEVNLV